MRLPMKPAVAVFEANVELIAISKGANLSSDYDYDSEYVSLNVVSTTKHIFTFLKDCKGYFGIRQRTYGGIDTANTTVSYNFVNKTYTWTDDIASFEAKAGQTLAITCSTSGGAYEIFVSSKNTKKSSTGWSKSYDSVDVGVNPTEDVGFIPTTVFVTGTYTASGTKFWTAYDKDINASKMKQNFGGTMYDLNVPTQSGTGGISISGTEITFCIEGCSNVKVFVT